MPSLSKVQHFPPARTAEPAADQHKLASGRAGDIRLILQNEIENGILLPGMHLDERALAERFEVSRTPVREALQHLAACNLVFIAPRHGVTVARLSIQDIRATLEFIGELESVCAKMSARRVTQALRQALDENLQSCQEAALDGDPRAYAIANAGFHEAIYEGSCNAYLSEHIRLARRRIQRYRVRDFETKNQILKSLQEHLRIARAIHAGDESQAAGAMLEHVPAGAAGFSEFLAAVPRNFLDAEPGDNAF
jgi:DNA-binding GntR family transcriptional regulator